MDHVWLDKNGQDEPDVVPLYGMAMPNRGGFSTYLSRTKLDGHILIDMSTVEPLYNVELRECIVNSIIQEWLFFGCLTEFFSVFDIAVKREDFLNERDGRRVVTTTQLCCLTAELVKSRLQDSDGYNAKITEQDLMQLFRAHLADTMYDPWTREDARRAGALHDMLTVSGQFIAQLLAACKLRNTTLLEWPNVLCILILNNTLTQLADIFIQCKVRIFLPDLGFLWQRRCVERGLCASKLAKFARKSTATDTYIATSLRDDEKRDHSRCTSVAPCTASKDIIQLPMHAEVCDGGCQTVALTDKHRAAVEASIEADSWAILEFSDNDEDSAVFRLNANVAGDAHFVALSHVWNHGLGNPLANALPTCQLLRLKRIMKRAGCESLGLWLDPLCVPLNSPYKTKAIANMDRVYKSADKVLVLDRQLLKTTGHPLLKAIRLELSEWMTRLWTLQEGLLPENKLYVVFGDSVLRLNEILQYPEPEPSDDLSSMVIDTMVPTSLSVHFMILREQDSLLSIVHSFHDRKTTRVEDEAYCLAILAGVPVLELPENPSLHHVIGKMQSIPQDLVFAPGPRCTIAGFRWLPKSFMSQDSPLHFYPPVPQQTRRDHRGIRLTKTMAVIQPGPQLNALFRSWQQGHQQYYSLSSNEQSLRPYQIMLLEAGTTCPEVRQRSRPWRSAVLVFERDLDIDALEPRSAAILVSNIHRAEGDSELCAQYQVSIPTLSYDHFARTEGEYPDFLILRLIAPTQENAVIWVD